MPFQNPWTTTRARNSRLRMLMTVFGSMSEAPAEEGWSEGENIAIEDPRAKICRNPKSQIPNPKQIPSTKFQINPKRQISDTMAERVLVGIWVLAFVWDLGFGFWDL